MNIYLVQHGKPVSKEEDPRKPLSGKGVEDIKKTAAFLKRIGATRVGAIFHSGKTRTRQTAEILGSTLLPGREPQEKAGLAALDDVRSLVRLEPRVFFQHPCRPCDPRFLFDQVKRSVVIRVLVHAGHSPQ